MTTIVLVGLVGLAAGAVLTWLLLQQRSKGSAGIEAQLQERTRELERHRQEAGQLRQELEQSRMAQVRLEEQAKSDKEKLSWLERAEKQIRELSDKVLSEQREVMTTRGKETFNETLKPFSKEMGELRKRIENLSKDASTERIELQTVVKSLSEQTGKISSEASELTQALKGDSQQRGAWGEITLQRVLEISGLSEGREYETQQSFSGEGEDGDKRRQPDVIVHLPNERDVVIDAKLTLNSWIEASQAKEEHEREVAIGKFCNAVQAQVDNLASKRYEDISAIRTLDFTLMYIPIEPAYACVLQEKAELVSNAFKQRVMLVSPTTLLPVLRIVENIWRVDNQSRNSQKIADEAGKMYDKLRNFVESLEKIGKGLEGAQRNYDEALKQLSTGKGNLIGRAEQIKALGANPKKTLPSSLTGASLPDSSEEPDDSEK